MDTFDWRMLSYMGPTEPQKFRTKNYKLKAETRTLTPNKNQDS